MLYPLVADIHSIVEKWSSQIVCLGMASLQKTYHSTKSRYHHHYVITIETYTPVKDMSDMAFTMKGLRQNPGTMMMSSNVFESPQ